MAIKRKKVKVPMYKKPTRKQKNAGGAVTYDEDYFQELYSQAQTKGFEGTYEQWFNNWMENIRTNFGGFAGGANLGTGYTGGGGRRDPIIGGGGGGAGGGGAGTDTDPASRTGAPLQSSNILGAGYDPAYGRVEKPTRPVIEQAQPAEYTTTLNKSDEELEEEARTGASRGGRLRAFVGGNINRSKIKQQLKGIVAQEGAKLEAEQQAAKQAAKEYDNWSKQNDPYYGVNTATITNVKRKDLISGTPEDQQYLQGAYYSRFYAQQQTGNQNVFDPDNVAYRNYTEDFGDFDQQAYEDWVNSVYGTAPTNQSSPFTFSKGGAVRQKVNVGGALAGAQIQNLLAKKQAEAARPAEEQAVVEEQPVAEEATTTAGGSGAAGAFGNTLETVQNVREGEYTPKTPEEEQWNTNKNFIVEQVEAGTATPEQQAWYDRWVASGSPIRKTGMKTQDQLDAENITPVNDAVTEYEGGTTTNNNGGGDGDDNPFDTSNGGGTTEAGPTGEGGGYVPAGSPVGEGGTDPGATEEGGGVTKPTDTTTSHASIGGELGFDPDDPDRTYTTVSQAVAPTVSGAYGRTATAGQTYTKANAVTKGTTTATLGPQAEATTYDAVTVADQVGTVDAAQGALSEGATAEVDEATLSERAVAAQRDPAAEEAAKAETAKYKISDDAYINEVLGETALVSPTREAEAAQREAITGVPADEGQAAQIVDKVGYEAAKMRAVTGKAAKGGAAEMVAAVGNLPPEISAVIVEDPATVEAAIDDEPVEVRAAVAALPTEALVSSQMESLLAGMEDGNIPAWARPAVANVTQAMAKRGLDVSTIARDALFNAIITSAMPMAQSNAQALQQRAAQNLSNEQQANIQQSNLDAQRRLQNTANQQTAASQTAQMAQQMATMQSQFAQDARFASAAQQQQMRMQNLQNQQQAALQNVQNQQATNAQNLGNEQQVELANLQYEFNTNAANMSAENQARMQEMQVAADFLAKNAGFKQQMEMANLSNDQQMRLANLTAMNQASSENLSAEQQTELANLNARMQTNILQGEIASRMNLAQLSVDQQRAVSNAAMVANMDMTQFSAEQQVKLANSKFMQSMTMADFNAEQQAAMQNATALASLDLANLDTRTRLAAQNAQAFLQMDMANLSNEQQATMLEAQMQQQALLSDQSMQNAARQFNAQSETQVDQFNKSLDAQIRQFNAQQQNAMKQFNASEANRLATTDMQLQAQLRATELQSSTTLLAAEVRAQSVADVTNAQLQANREQFNAQNQFVAEQAAIDYSRKVNTLNTAAENEMIKLNAQQNFQLTAMEYESQLLEARDTANFLRTDYMTDKQLKTNLYIAAIGNETAASKESSQNISQLMGFVDGLLGS